MNEQVGLGGGTCVWDLCLGLGGGTWRWDLCLGLGGGTWQWDLMVGLGGTWWMNVPTWWPHLHNEWFYLKKWKSSNWRSKKLGNIVLNFKCPIVLKCFAFRDRIKVRSGGIYEWNLSVCLPPLKIVIILKLEKMSWSQIEFIWCFRRSR